MTRQEILKNAKPILFNTDMVRSMLDGRKTVTRRLIKPQPKARLSYLFAGYGCGKWSYPSKGAVEIWGADYQSPDDLTEEEKGMLWTPPCHTDDILYVRETWCLRYDGEKYFYKADKHTPREEKRLIDYDHVSWKPSIHMPKEAARIFLKVTNVRVEQLQEITWQEAAREGCYGSTSDEPDPLFNLPTLRGEFQKLWNSTIKKSELERYGWYANPWIWVIEFERIEVE